MPVLAKYAVGAYRASEASVLIEPKYGKRNGTSTGVIAVHGHNANCLTWQLAGTGFGNVSRGLAENGFTVLSIDAGGLTPWADDDEMAAMDAAYTYLQGISAKTPVCVVGWSMGGLASLNWVKRNPTKVSRAIVWAPATDIAYFHANNTGYATEIEADYGGAAAWSTNISGHSPATEPANYRGLPPIRIYHGDADTTVPLSQTQSFVTNVNDPNLVLHTVSGADHVTVGNVIDGSTAADFFYGRTSA